MKLRNGLKTLVEDVFQRLVVCANHKGASPEIRMPMPYGLRQANQLALISSEGTVTRSQGTTEEHHCAAALVKYCANAGTGCVTFNHKRQCEIRQGKD